MRNRQKGGLPPAAATQPTPGSLAAGAANFLEHLAARVYSKASIEAHQWALKGFVEWADSLDLTSPAALPVQPSKLINSTSTITDRRERKNHWGAPQAQVEEPHPA